MRSIRNIAIVIAGVLLSLSAYPQAKDYRDIKTPPLHAQKVEQPKRIQLANGMVIFLMEDHELPLIRGGANIRGGERDEPSAMTGLVQIMGQAWRTGGRAARPTPAPGPGPGGRTSGWSPPAGPRRG